MTPNSVRVPHEAAQGSALLRATGLRKRFDDTTALDGFDLEVREGELLALLGPSACGKTTALRVIAGLERPDDGEVWVRGRRLAGGGAWVPPERRRIGLVFQDWALFPHLDVRRNVAFGLDGGLHGEGRVAEVLSLVGLDGMEDRMPHELSGGQQQRVALARALAPAPDVVLMDEPFSNLDTSLRAKVRGEVRELLRGAGVTAVFVTHDQEEALAISDRIAVMASGRVLQTGSPGEVYAWPATAEIARLLGEANFVPAAVRSGTALTSLGPIPAPGLADGDRLMMVRPEALQLEEMPGAGARVEHVEFYGHDQMIRIRLPDGRSVEVRRFGPFPPPSPGTAVALRLEGPVRFFDSEA